MSQRPLEEIGKEMGERIWGRSRFAQMEQSVKELHPAFWNLAQVAWSLFARPGLGARERSLCLVAALTVLGRTEELGFYIFVAMNNGATPQEIEEAIVQTGPYGGLPTARSALITAKKCFAKYQPLPDR